MVLISGSRHAGDSRCGLLVTTVWLFVKVKRDEYTYLPRYVPYLSGWMDICDSMAYLLQHVPSATPNSAKQMERRRDGFSLVQPRKVHGT